MIAVAVVLILQVAFAIFMALVFFFLLLLGSGLPGAS
jgi:hypothetical protein